MAKAYSMWWWGRMGRLVACLVLALGLAPVLQAQAPLAVDAMWSRGYTFVPEQRFNLPAVLALKPWRVAVLFPYMQDPVFVAAAYGIDEQARESGVVTSMFVTDGYDAKVQDRQLRQIAAQHSADGIVLAATDFQKLESALETVRAAGIPVVTLLNDVASTNIAAKAISSTEAMGYQAAEQMMRLAAGRDIRVAFIPGPQGSAWARDMYQGNAKAIRAAQGRNQKVTLMEPVWTEMTTEALAAAVRVVGAEEKLDFLIANGPAAVIASRRSPGSGPRILSNYLIPDVLQAIRRGTIAAASDAKPVEQGRAALRLVTGILNGVRVGKDLPFWVSVPSEIVTIRESSRPPEQFFGPANYRPRVTSGNAL